MQSDATGGNLCQSDAIRGNPCQSDALRCNHLPREPSERTAADATSAAASVPTADSAAAAAAAAAPAPPTHAGSRADWGKRDRREESTEYRTILRADSGDVLRGRTHGGGVH